MVSCYALHQVCAVVFVGLNKYEYGRNIFCGFLAEQKQLFAK